MRYLYHQYQIYMYRSTYWSYIETESRYLHHQREIRVPPICDTCTPNIRYMHDQYVDLHKITRPLLFETESRYLYHQYEILVPPISDTCTPNMKYLYHQYQIYA